MVFAPVDGKAAFTYTTSKKMGGNHNDGCGSCDPIIQSSQQKCLCASAGSSNHTNAIRIYIFSRNKIVKYSAAVTGLKDQRVIDPVLYLYRFTVTDNIVYKNDGSHSCEDSSPFLDFFHESAIVPVPMRTQDGRNFSGIFIRAIKISGDIESGEAFYCYVFYLITIHLFCTSDDRLKRVLFLRPGVHAQSGLDSLPYGLCSLFPFFPVVP